MSSRLTFSQYFNAMILAKATIRIFLGAFELRLLAADHLEYVALGVRHKSRLLDGTWRGNLAHAYSGTYLRASNSRHFRQLHFLKGQSLACPSLDEQWREKKLLASQFDNEFIM